MPAYSLALHGPASMPMRLASFRGFHPCHPSFTRRKEKRCEHQAAVAVSPRPPSVIVPFLCSWPPSLCTILAHFVNKRRRLLHSPVTGAKRGGVFRSGLPRSTVAAPPTCRGPGCWVRNSPFAWIQDFDSAPEVHVPPLGRLESRGATATRLRDAMGASSPREPKGGEVAVHWSRLCSRSEGCSDWIVAESVPPRLTAVVWRRGMDVQCLIALCTHHHRGKEQRIASGPNSDLESRRQSCSLFVCYSPPPLTSATLLHLTLSHPLSLPTTLGTSLCFPY